jgi:NADH-quinone oxidoreductase subunit M
MNAVGVGGSILYMINHGLSTGALFLCIGMIYERYHTRDMDELGGLASKMPVWAFFMVFFSMASVGLPGLNGFVSEFMCMLGAFQAGAAWGPGGTGGVLGPWFAAVAATGMVVAAMYILYMVGKVVFGPLTEPAGHHEHETLPTDLSAREITVLAPLAVACLVLGVYPTPVIRSLEAPILEQLAHVERYFPESDDVAPPAPDEHAGHDHASASGSDGLPPITFATEGAAR